MKENEKGGGERAEYWSESYSESKMHCAEHSRIYSVITVSEF